jgi:hypothetical protein
MGRWCWILLALLVTGYLWLGRRGAEVYRARYGDFVNCLARPQESDGRRIKGTRYDVVAVEPGGMTIDRRGFRARVRWAGPVAVGDVVELAGTFRGDGTIHAERVVVMPHFRLKTGLMIAGSLAVLIGVADGFIRRRRTRFSEGLIRERPCPTP